MSAVIDAISSVFGWVMRFIYDLFGSYGLSIIIFTIFTKMLLFPVNIFIQKNSIKMVRLQPELNALKIKYIDDKDKYADAQLSVYKKHKYHPLLGVVPLLAQLILVMGVLGVVYKPMTFMLGISDGDVSTLGDWLSGTMGVKDAGNSAQVRIIQLLQSGAAAPDGLSAGVLDKILGFDMHFLGLDLGMIPKITAGLSNLIIPFCAGLSAYILCFAQNKINILQLTASKFNRIFTTIFMVGFSCYLVFLVPQGVGLYWTCGNLFAIPPMILLNMLIPPKKHVDLDYLYKVRDEMLVKEQKYKKYHKKEKADYKRFFSNEKMHIMIYAEGKGFYKYFQDIIENILKLSEYDIHYVTGDPEDPRLDDTREHFKSYYIARDKYIIPLFMKLDCDVVLMTTPDLGKYHIKRSKVRKDIEYIYMQHGIGSIYLRYRKGALNNYDTFFLQDTSAQYAIRFLENYYKSKKKKLVEVGCPLLDTMAKEYAQTEHTVNEIPQIIIAPSWQPDNIIDMCGEKLVEELAKTGYRVILRPHPQQVRHDPAFFEMMKNKFAGDPNIEIQTDFSANSPVFESDLLITDWSGICFEFAFTTLRPVLFINTPEKIMNSDFDKNTVVEGVKSLRDLVGENVEPDELDRVPELVKNMLDNKEQYKDKIDKVYHENIYGIGKSGQLAALYIIRSVEKKQGAKR